MRDYTLSYPALTGEVVTEGHARYCRENGHSTHIVAGVRDIFCPRCGDRAWKFCACCKGPIEIDSPPFCEYCAPSFTDASGPQVMSDTPDSDGTAYYVPAADDYEIVNVMGMSMSRYAARRMGAVDPATGRVY